MKKILFSLLFLFGLTFYCEAQTQWELTEQTKREYQKAEFDMTKVYKLVLSKMSSQKQKQELIEAQRAWIKYKESHCKAISNLYEGGSMQPMVNYQCLTEVANQRKKLLEQYLEVL